MYCTAIGHDVAPFVFPAILAAQGRKLRPTQSVVPGKCGVLWGLNPSLYKLVRLAGSVLHPVVSSASDSCNSVCRQDGERPQHDSDSESADAKAQTSTRADTTNAHQQTHSRAHHTVQHVLYEVCLDELLLLAVAVGSHIPFAWCSQSPRLAIKFFSNRRCTAYISSLLRRRVRVLKPFYHLHPLLTIPKMPTYLGSSSLSVQPGLATKWVFH